MRRGGHGFGVGRSEQSVLDFREALEQDVEEKFFDDGLAVDGESLGALCVESHPAVVEGDDQMVGDSDVVGL